jgi:hypothetical protein
MIGCLKWLVKMVTHQKKLYLRIGPYYQGKPRNKFGIIQEYPVVFIFHEKELIRNYLGIPIPI